MTAAGTPPVVFVDIYKSRVASVFRRPQPWRWRAISAGNRRKLATSGEGYTNRQDCLDDITLLFADKTNVYLRRREQDGWPEGTPLGLGNLRWAA